MEKSAMVQNTALRKKSHARHQAQTTKMAKGEELFNSGSVIPQNNTAMVFTIQLKTQNHHGYLMILTYILPHQHAPVHHFCGMVKLASIFMLLYTG